MSQVVSQMAASLEVARPWPSPRRAFPSHSLRLGAGVGIDVAGRSVGRRGLRAGGDRSFVL